MTEQQQKIIDECNVALRLVHLEIETVIEVDGNGDKIGTPKPPRK